VQGRRTGLTARPPGRRRPAGRLGAIELGPIPPSIGLPKVQPLRHPSRPWWLPAKSPLMQLRQGFASGSLSSILGIDRWLEPAGFDARVPKGIHLSASSPPLDRPPMHGAAFAHEYVASPTRSPPSKAALSYLALSGAAPICIIDRDGIATFRIASKVAPAAITNRAGWTVGTGVDWAFAPNWSANLEYNYYDFGDHVATVTSTANNSVVTVPSLKDKLHAVTAGVDYHF
jgi:hypothetical protein